MSAINICRTRFSDPYLSKAPDILKLVLMVLLITNSTCALGWKGGGGVLGNLCAKIH